MIISEWNWNLYCAWCSQIFPFRTDLGWWCPATNACCADEHRWFKSNSQTFLKPHKRLQKIIVGVGYTSQHPWDESLQAEDELETLKKRYQKNMALVSRQAKVPLLILFGLVGLVEAHLGHLCTVFARVFGGQELEDCQEEVDTWKEEAATKSQTIAEHLQAVVSGLMYLDVIIWCIWCIWFWKRWTGYRIPGLFQCSAPHGRRSSAREMSWRRWRDKRKRMQPVHWSKVRRWQQISFGEVSASCLKRQAVTMDSTPRWITIGIVTGLVRTFNW